MGQRVLGGLLGLFTGIILIVGSLVAIPSMWRYRKLRNM